MSREKVPGTEPTMALPSKGMYLLLRTVVVLGCLVSFSSCSTYLLTSDSPLRGQPPMLPLSLMSAPVSISS